MPVHRLKKNELRSFAEPLGFHLDGSELDQLHELITIFVGGFDAIDALPEPERPAVPVREHRVPAFGENEYGAWVRRTALREQQEGRLAGKTVALKDTIALAGVPMSGGAAFLDGYVPEQDATVVRRVLDAGGEILGKAACEYLSMSSGSHTSWTGPVRNPRDPERTAGGSSSG